MEAGMRGGLAADARQSPENPGGFGGALDFRSIPAIAAQSERSADKPLDASSTPTRTRSSAPPGSPPLKTAAAWLAAFVLYECLRIKAAKLGVLPSPARFFAVVSALDLAQVVLIGRLLLRTASEQCLSPGKAAAVLAVIALAAIGGGANPLLPVVALSGVAVWLCRGSSLAPAAFAVALFGAQSVLPGWPFLPVHEAFGRLDAAVVRSLLKLGGVASAGAGTLVLIPGQRQGFDVLYGCATSTTLAEVIPAFLVVVLCLRGRFARTDRLWLLGLTAAIFPANWLRLLLICGPPDRYVYWHEGAGAGLFGLAYGVLILGAGALAVRGRRAAAPL